MEIATTAEGDSHESINAPYPASEFDDWAGSYDADVAAGSGFPFEGYPRVLDTVVEMANPRPADRVLDAGIGTGNLAARFVELGCSVWGIDFSAAMLHKAAGRLPQVALIQADLVGKWPSRLQRPFDRIVSTYTFHHFPLDQKVRLAGRLANLLSAGGSIVIADIAFTNGAALKEARNSIPDWEDEPFWLIDQALPALTAAGFEVICQTIPPWAAVFHLRPRNEQP